MNYFNKIDQPNNPEVPTNEKFERNPQSIQPTLHLEDARNISTILSDTKINTTVTSPPYFDVKDYGSNGQIGFGQNYDEYLSDLYDIFKKIYHHTQENGSLWIIIDTFRREGEIIPLPFDLAKKIKNIGWKLKDIIIWKKDRTLPWTTSGATRNIFEYILVFSKNNDEMKYYPDRVRDHTDLKQWWVKYQGCSVLS